MLSVELSEFVSSQIFFFGQILFQDKCRSGVIVLLVEWCEPLCVLRSSELSKVWHIRNMPSGFELPQLFELFLTLPTLTVMNS